MKHKSGITLIEILIVIAIISVLASIGFMSFQRYTWRTELRQAQNLIVNTINQARSDTRRTSASTFFQWSTTSVGSGDTLATIAMQNLNDNGRVSITGVTGVTTGTTNFSYTAPNARRDGSNTIVFTLQGRGNFQGKVKVIGITGKAFAE
jgi:prepilin-type N-terminal cleavage/methylation domain-containing protein